MEFNRYLDHSILIPTMTAEEVVEGLKAGLAHQVRSVCMRPRDIELALDMCQGSTTAVGCVLDFPHGAAGAASKEALATLYTDLGVQEIDMVMDFAAARSHDWDTVEEGIKRVVNVAHKKGVLVKVIFETSVLTQEEIRKATEIAIRQEADFIKSSTGFGGDVTQEAVECMLEAAAGRIQVKVSGGIPDAVTAKNYIDMGATRIGVKYSLTPFWVKAIASL